MSKDKSDNINPAIYTKIAKKCREIGELELGIYICRRGLIKFPKDTLLNNTKGEIYILLFNKDKNSKYLLLALKCFEKILNINPHNYLAKILSSHIYLRGGAIDKAKERILSILHTAPDDINALKLQKEIKKREERKKKKEKISSDESPDLNVTKKEKKDFEESAPDKITKKEEINKLEKTDLDNSQQEEGQTDKNVEKDIYVSDEPEKEEKKEEEEEKNKENTTEEEGISIEETAPIEETTIEETSRINYSILLKYFSTLKKIDGLKGLFLLDKYGTIIKHINKSNFDENLLSAIAGNIFRSSQTGMQKVKLGAFKNGMLMTPEGNMYLVNIFGAIIFIFTALETNQQDVEDTISLYLKKIEQ